VLAGCHLLFPCLDLLLFGKSIRLEHSADHVGYIAWLLETFDSTLEAFDLGYRFVSVLFGLGGDSKLGELLGRLLAVLAFARALDVHGEGVLGLLGVLATMDTLAGASTVEAMQANIETLGLVDVVKAECAVFAVDRVCGCGRVDGGVRRVWART
jgi:hypothetical protein